jgi:hypothetical protein
VAAPLSVLPSGLVDYPHPSVALARLRAFRAGLYACCTRRADALVDLTDALLSAPGPVLSLPQLSLEPAHRRGWGSLYAALACGRIDAERLRDLLVGCLPPADPLVFAVDVTAWPRCDAECSPERGLYSHPSRHSAGQPIVAGWAYQWICQLSFARDSWTAPVDARRRQPLDDTDQTAAGQIRALLARLPAGGPLPLVVLDAGDDSAQLSLDLADLPVAVVVRLRSDRCLLRRPAASPAWRWRPAAPPRGQVRLRRLDHLAGPDRHPCHHRRPVRHRHRAGLGGVASQAAPSPRPRQRRTPPDRARHRHPRPGPAGPRPHPSAKVLWLWWAGPGQLDLDLAWRAYTRRFDLEHTVRFAKQTLGWTAPRPRHPAQADRWTWLVLTGYTQLRLARQIATDTRLPWERPRPPGMLSPYRVRPGFPRLLCALGSPAAAPKPSGRSPGRPKGSRPGPATRYPAIKKPTRTPRNKTTKAPKAA